MGKQVPYGYIDDVTDVTENDVRALIGRRISHVTAQEYRLQLQLDDGQILDVQGNRWEGVCLGVVVMKADSQMIERFLDVALSGVMATKLAALIDRYSGTLIKSLVTKSQVILYKPVPDGSGIFMAMITHGDDHDCYVWMSEFHGEEEKWTYVPRFLAPFHFFKMED